MDILAFVKKNLTTILLIIALMAIGLTTYEHFFSSKAKLLREYKSQIKQQQERIDVLTTEYNKLTEEEKQRIDMIDTLKMKLEELKTSVADNEADLTKIQDETIDIETALQNLENHTRGSLSRGRDIMDKLAAGAGE